MAALGSAILASLRLLGLPSPLPAPFAASDAIDELTFSVARAVSYPAVVCSLHHLYSVLEPTGTRLRGVYPAIDRPGYVRFAAEVWKWLDELRRREVGGLPRTVVVRKSIIEGGVGEQFQLFLLGLCDYAMEVVAQRDYGRSRLVGLDASCPGIRIDGANHKNSGLDLRKQAVRESWLHAIREQELSVELDAVNHSLEHEQHIKDRLEQELKHVDMAIDALPTHSDADLEAAWDEVYNRLTFINNNLSSVIATSEFSPAGSDPVDFGPILATDLNSAFRQLFDLVRSNPKYSSFMPEELQQKKHQFAAMCQVVRKSFGDVASTTAISLTRAQELDDYIRSTRKRLREVNSTPLCYPSEVHSAKFVKEIKTPPPESYFDPSSITIDELRKSIRAKIRRRHITQDAATSQRMPLVTTSTPGVEKPARSSSIRRHNADIPSKQYRMRHARDVVVEDKLAEIAAHIGGDDSDADASQVDLLAQMMVQPSEALRQTSGFAPRRELPRSPLRDAVLQDECPPWRDLSGIFEDE